MGNLWNRFGGNPEDYGKPVKGLHDDAPKKHITKGPGDSPLQAQLKKAKAAHAEAVAKPAPKGMGTKRNAVTIDPGAANVTQSNVTPKGGRKKQHASAAEKQKAYRERLRGKP